MFKSCTEELKVNFSKLLQPTDVLVSCRVFNLWDKMSGCAHAYSELRNQVVDSADNHLSKVYSS